VWRIVRDTPPVCANRNHGKNTDILLSINSLFQELNSEMVGGVAELKGLFFKDNECPSEVRT